MTIQQEDVIRIAQEAGIDAYPDHLSSYDSESVKISVITRFVELVAAYERDNIARWYATDGWMLDENLVADAIRARGK